MIYDPSCGFDEAKMGDYPFFDLLGIFYGEDKPRGHGLFGSDAQNGFLHMRQRGMEP